MQKIEKYFPHSTMQEFMATLNEETLEGVFTLRLTPHQFEDLPGVHAFMNDWSTEDIVNWLDRLKKRG